MTPSFEIENALLVQPIEECSDFGFDAGSFYGWKFRRKLADDVVHGTPAIATLHNLSSGANQAKNAFGD